MFSLLLRGFVLGFAVAASPGPVFFLCLRRSIVQGRLHGLLSGLGVATADGVYAALATFGITAVMSVLIAERRPIAAVGGVALAALGVSFMLRHPRPVEPAAPAGSPGLAFAYLSTAGVTLANPATILSFVALAATLGLGTGGSLARPAFVVFGVLAGSTAWWFVLAFAASWLRPGLTPRVLRGIGILSGMAIFALSVAAVYTAFT